MKVWEGKGIPQEVMVQTCVQEVEQWREAQTKKSHNGLQELRAQPDAVKWKHPSTGKHKLNVDASVIANNHSFSMGMILRDHNGKFCKAKTVRRIGDVSVFEAEAQGVLEALKWIIELGVHEVELESDSKLTVNAIVGNTPNYLEVGNILQECRELMKDRPDLMVSFVRKQANRVAHLLARVPCEADSFHVFFSPPQSVLESILYDAALS